MCVHQARTSRILANYSCEGGAKKKERETTCCKYHIYMLRTLEYLVFGVAKLRERENQTTSEKRNECRYIHTICKNDKIGSLGVGGVIFGRF